MAENTKIEWATHSWSPWIGCAKIHTGCLNCYAEADFATRRKRVVWGPNGTRSVTSDEYWRKPITWNRKADETGERVRVFPSLCDPFEDHCDVAYWREGMFDLIDNTPNLDWVLLTKRPENILRMWPDKKSRQNVWLLYSASDQESLELGAGSLIDCLSLARIVGVSLEPLLGPISLSIALSADRLWFADPTGMLKWVIVGGESGPNARPFKMVWLEQIVAQCQGAGVPVFVKQDYGKTPGQRGRISDAIWKLKQLPQVG